MKFALVMMVMISSAAAYADGFVCKTMEGDLNVKVYNHTDASQGTRTGAVMVLSDPAVGAGRKTIARFTEVNDLLTSTGASYSAKVDLRFNDSSRKGELILGTKLGYVDLIDLDVDYNYNQPVAAGTSLQGQLTLTKRNGETVSREVSCLRYLKGDVE